MTLTRKPVLLVFPTPFCFYIVFKLSIFLSSFCCIPFSFRISPPLYFSYSIFLLTNDTGHIISNPPGLVVVGEGGGDIDDYSIGSSFLYIKILKLPSHLEQDIAGHMGPRRALRAIPGDTLPHHHLPIGGNGPGNYGAASHIQPRLNGDVQELGGAQLPPGTGGLQPATPCPPSSAHVVSEGLAAMEAGREVGGILPAVSEKKQMLELYSVLTIKRSGETLACLGKSLTYPRRRACSSQRSSQRSTARRRRGDEYSP
jgi:hypothetical protein